MSSNEPPLFAVGDKLKIADELQPGDLVFFDRSQPGRIEVRTVGLGDLDGSHTELLRVYPGAAGPQFVPVLEPFEDLMAWERLRHIGSAAEEKGSNWGRFAIPMEAVAIYAAGETVPPRRRLEDIEMADEVRESLKGYLLLCSKVPPPAEPSRVLAGLRIQPGQIPEEGREDLLETMFSPGSVVELQGMLSSSVIAEPPLVAAGVDGAILDILISNASYMSHITGFNREAEFALPMDCRCQVISFGAEASYEVTGGHTFTRPTIQLEQISD